MIGRRAAPLDIALEAGSADEVVLGGEDSAVEAVLHRTRGEGVATTFETVGGTAQILAEALGMTRRGGAISVLGLFMTAQTVDPALGMSRELTVRWSNSFSTWQGESEYDGALALASTEAIDPRPFITHHFDLDHISEAFAAADDKAGSGAIRVMVHP